MSQEIAENIIEREQNVVATRYPAGFLQQLGSVLGQVVGLGEPSAERLPYGQRSLSFPVRTQSDILGFYEIVTDRLGIVSVCYEGRHPVAQRERQAVPKSIGLSADRRGNKYKMAFVGTQDYEIVLVREDGWKAIDFPGFPPHIERYVEKNFSKYPKNQI